MSDDQTALPGDNWLEIIRRSSQAAFAAAFTEDVALVTSVANGAIVGPVGVRHFFDATRAMYDSIAFVHETSAGSRTCLEWKGTFQGRDVAGITVLCRNRQGRIEGIQLYHSPYEQVLAFSTELAHRLEGKLVLPPFPGH
jgi:hypothetical protein